MHEKKDSATEVGVVELSHYVGLAATIDLAQLHHLGWSDEALQARAQVMEILEGWLASGVVELAVMPAPPEIEPLARLAEADTPAANDAAMLLALLETGRWMAAQTLFMAKNNPIAKAS